MLKWGRSQANQGVGYLTSIHTHLLTFGNWLPLRLCLWLKKPHQEPAWEVLCCKSLNSCSHHWTVQILQLIPGSTQMMSHCWKVPFVLLLLRPARSEAPAFKFLCPCILVSTSVAAAPGDDAWLGKSWLPTSNLMPLGVDRCVVCQWPLNAFISGMNWN